METVAICVAFCQSWLFEMWEGKLGGGGDLVSQAALSAGPSLL